MNNLKLANMGLSFSVEVAMWLAYGYWGFHQFSGPAGWLVGLGLPAISLAIWSVWAAPKSKSRLKQPKLVVLKLVLFALAGLALLAAGQQLWAGIFAAFALLNQILEYYFDSLKNT
jgi:hypothetical protein